VLVSLATHEHAQQRETDKEYIKALEERLRKTEALLADVWHITRTPTTMLTYA
jgi:hypothetical protein